MQPIYEIRSTNYWGQDGRSYPNATATSGARDELNGIGSFGFKLPSNDPGLIQVDPGVREVQLWRKTRLVWTGPVTNRNAADDLDNYDIQCKGLFWYFTKRFFGAIRGRNNYLPNGSFDAGNLGSWTAVGVTAQAVTQWGGRPGQTYQANLYQANAGTDTFLRQAIGVPGGNLWTLSANFEIRMDATWVGPAINGRGLYVERRHPTTGVVEDVQFFAITDDTPRGTFQRATVQIFTPPGRDSILDVRLYAPGVTNPTPVAPRPPGSIIWDDVKLTLMESSSWPYADMGEILNGIMAHAQDPAMGKTNLNIALGAGLTGINLDRTYQHADRREILDALMEFPSLGFCDLSILCEQNGVNRNFLVHVPRKGKTWTHRFEQDAPMGIMAVSGFEEDATQVTNTVIYQGEGDGPERDEGYFQDLTAMNGISYEAVEQAAPGFHHDLLTGLATRQVQKQGAPPKVPTITVSGKYVGGDAGIEPIETGDILPLVITRDVPRPIQGALYRVVATEIDVDNDLLRLEVNPV